MTSQSVRPILPGPELIRRSLASLEVSVAPDMIDTNGHMNVQHYLRLGARGTGTLVEGLLGIDEAFRAQKRQSVFTKNHVLNYYSELVENDPISVHPFALARSSSAIHLMTYVLDQGRDRLACSLETLLVYVDLETRRPIRMPASVIQHLDICIEASRAGHMPHPVSGTIKLTSPARRTTRR